MLTEAIQVVRSESGVSIFAQVIGGYTLCTSSPSLLSYSPPMPLPSGNRSLTRTECALNAPSLSKKKEKKNRKKIVGHETGDSRSHVGGRTCLRPGRTPGDRRLFSSAVAASAIFRSVSLCFCFVLCPSSSDRRRARTRRQPCVPDQ